MSVLATALNFNRIGGIGEPATADDLAELVSSSDAIVIGTITGVVGEEVVYLLETPTPPADPAQSSITLPDDSITVTELSVDVERLLKDDGAIGSRVTLTVPGRVPSSRLEWLLDNTLSSFPAGEPGSRFLFFVSLNEPGNYGLPYGPCARIALNAQDVRCSNREHRILRFAEHMTPGSFTEAVAKEIERQSWSGAN